jgi:hypothetical protein
MPDAGLSCQASVEGIIQQPISVFIGGELEPERNAAVESFRVQLDKNPKAMVKLVDDEMDADYTFWAGKDGFYTYLPFDRNRPLLKPISYIDKSGNSTPGKKVELAFNDFIQISKWEFLRNLEHYSAESGIQSPIEFRLIEGGEEGQEKRIYPAGNKFTFELTPEKPSRRIRFEIENHGAEQMYCSLVYMPQNFGFLATEDTGFMDRPQRGLGEGDILRSKVKNNNKYLTLKVSDNIIHYNWSGENNYLKLIFSNTPFDITAFHLDPLPVPGKESTGTTRTLGFEEPIMPPVQWEIRTFELFITNPSYQPES